MDALRKAEQQKQRLGTPDPTDQAGGLQLEPIASQDAGLPLADTEHQASPTLASGKQEAGSLPELPSRLEDLDEQFLAHAQNPPLKPKTPVAPPPIEPAAAPVKRETAQAAKPGTAAASPEDARNLFEAKQTTRPPAKRSMMIAVGLLGFSAALGVGGYVWWQMQPPSGLLTSGAPAISPQPLPPPATVPQAAAPLPPPQVTAPAAPPIEPAVVATVPPAPTSDPVPPAPRRGTSPKPASPTVESIEQPQLPIRLTRAQEKVDTTLEQAYQAFNRGDKDQARTLWRKTLAGEPLNADALHGLAALALQQNRLDEAASHYRRALDANPKDAIALSALASLNATTDPLQAESQLKTQLADQPNSPHLNFALGNLYARTARWPEAQQAFFKAHTADPANPDYLFNLAVSLDQLRQPHLASQYYARALAAAEQQTASFDPAQVAIRLKLLQSSLLH